MIFNPFSLRRQESKRTLVRSAKCPITYGFFDHEVFNFARVSVLPVHGLLDLDWPRFHLNLVQLRQIIINSFFNHL